jgi:hypothetical protein
MDRDSQVLGRGIKTVFIAVGVLTLVVGLAMFALPERAGVGTWLPNGKPAGDQWWPWPLWSVLNTRFLGALFIGVGVGSFWSAAQRVWGQVRGLFPPGLTFTGLATVAAFMNISAYNQQRIATWAFFAIYIVVFVAGLIAFIRYERGSGVQ